MQRKRFGRCGRGRFSFELLESRLAMAGVVINEFVADNASGLQDEDGAFSDWVELKNTDAAPVDITGWYLTDDASNLTKWQLPATVLDPGEFLVVFASSKNRAVSGQELHTNFGLSKDGEYLGLVMANGTTVASEFDPFPAQFEDVSFGTGASTTTTANVTLVGASSALKVISPTASNAAVDDHWRQIGFNDSGWLPGTRSVGFDRNGTAGLELGEHIGRTLLDTEMDSSDATPQYSAYVRYSFNVDNKDQLTSLQLDLRFDDGFIAYLNGREVRRVNFAEDFVYNQPQWNSYAGNQTTGGSSGAANRILESDDVVTFDLTPFLYELVNGTNVLAFHAVNSNSTSSGSTNKLDFLVEPVLTATRATSTANETFMAAPTPGGDNGLGTLGIVADTQFSVGRGFYTSAQSVVISTATSGATIRYTTDGSVPTLTNGTTYAGPLNIDETTTLRVAAFKEGYTPTNVDTQTYIFVDDVILQSPADVTQPYATWGHEKDGDGLSGYNLDDESDWSMDPDIVTGNEAAVKNALMSIPTISIVMNWDDLFNGTPQPGTFAGVGTVAPAPQGIYVMGRSDERAMSLEFINPNAANDQFQIDAGIEIQGHSSPTRWNTDKLSLQVKFKDVFGPGDLDYALFAGSPDGENSADEFDTFILDAMFNYAWIHQNTAVQTNYARYVTDQVVADLQNLASGGGEAPHGKYVHLYINGLYWGLYNAHERPDESFAEQYYGGDKDDYYVVKHANGDIEHEYTWVEGGQAAEIAYQSMLDTSRLDMTNAANYNSVANVLDVDQFIDYMIVHYYAGGGADWSHNNWYATFNHVEAGGKWRFHAWDQEHAFPTTDNDAAESTDWNEFSDLTGKDDFEAPTELFRNLIANTEFKLRFSDRVQELMNNGGALTEAAAQAAYVARLNEIDQAIIGESARWGDNRFANDPFTRQDWVDVNLNDTTGDMKAVVPDFFPVRTGVVLADFAGAGWLQSLAAPVFNNYGGEVASGFDVTITKPGGSPALAEVYYTLDESDPRLAGGAANPLALHSTGPINVDIDETTQIKARIKNGSEWSAIIDATFTVPDPLPVRITEIHYHPDNFPGVGDADDLEFIELTNTGSESVSLDGVQITQFATPGYTFANGLTLAAGERIVVARTPAVFQSVYGSGINLAPAGYATANLGNSGERVVLVGPFGETLQDFTYDDAGAWVTSPDGNGPSLEIIDPLGDPSNAANWRASAAAGGSPGTASRVAGDYDYDGAVEQADHGRWTTRFGATVTPTLGADGNGDGAVNAADYVMWRKLFEASPGAGGGSAAPLAVAIATDQAAPEAVSKTAAADKSASPAAVSFVLPFSAEVSMRPRMTAASGFSARGAVASTIDRANLVDALMDDACRRWSDDTAADGQDEASPELSSSRKARHDLDAEVWSDASWLNAESWRPRLTSPIAT